MAVISKSLLYADHLVYHKTVDSSSGDATLFLAPYAFHDSANPLGLLTWPLSTAVTVGQKFTLPVYRGDMFYAECTVAGTTAATEPFNTTTSLPKANATFTSGTATFKARAGHGWARALVRYSTASTFNPYTHITALIASTATVPSWGTSTTVWSTDTSSIPRYMKRGTFSVSKASGDRPNVYQAGAVLTRQWANQDSMIASELMIERGITYRNTFPESTSSSQAGVWTSGRYMDCTFEVPMNSNASNTRLVAHYGTYRALRCTFRNTATLGTYSQGAFGLRTGTSTSADACTFERSRASTAANDPILMLSGVSSAAAQGQLSMLGGDLSAISQPSFAHLPDSIYYYPYEATANLYGMNFNASYPPEQFNPDGSAYTKTLARQLQVGAGSTTYDRYDFSSKNRTFTRSGGANDGVGAFSIKVQISRKISYIDKIWFMNARVNEGFTISFDVQYTAVAGITGLSEEDFWIEALYFVSPTTRQMQFVSSIQNRRTRPGLFPGGAGPRILPTSASTWAGSLPSAVKQRASVVVSPRREGPIIIRIGTWLCPWTSSLITPELFQVYICPKPILSAA